MNPVVAIGIIVCTIIISIIFFLIEKPQTLRSKLINLAGCIALGSFLGLIFGLMISYSLTPDTHIESSKHNLISLQDKNGINGRLFLGTGKMFSESEYAFYTEDSVGFYNLHTVCTHRSSITYTTDTPYVVIYRRVRSDTKWNDYARGALFNEPKFVFHVPKNSIVVNYNLDAK